MKKIIFTILIIHFSFLVANAQWTLMYTLNNTEHIEYLCVVDTLSVWGAGTLGFPGDTSLVYKMKPPGIWYKLPMQSFMYTTRLSCIAAQDTSKAWVGTYDGKIYMTSDGGYSWEMIFSFGGSSFINDIKFSKTNKLIGYANSDPPNGFGTPFKILKTTNGGLNWTVFSPTFSNNYIGMTASSCVTDVNHYWMGLNCQSCGVPKLAYTTNGGANWLESTVSHTAHYLWPIEFTSNNMLGFCSSSGASPTGYLHKSTNGGLSWSNYYLLPFQDNLNTLNWIEGTSNWYFSSWSNIDPIYKSTNNGLNWNPMTINNNFDQIMSLSFIRKSNRIWGYATTLNRKIFKLAQDTAILININNVGNSIPEKYSLYQNYPNPFNPVTKIKFEIANSSPSIPLQRGTFVELKIFDIVGKEIATLVNESLNSGTYEVDWDASNFSSGVYFYRLTAGHFSETKKMLLLK